MSSQNVMEMLHSGQRDVEWFNSNFSRFKREFNNSFIAFHNEQIIDSDKDLEILMKKLENKKVDTSSVFIEFVSSVKTIL